ncbi:class I SAM-dependent methyltransferase [Cryobacterium serini]|uniref:Methyltransferase domain-containing protein n=1 Tax=Cryobacterium serini TaxID=1259201 RepID=A0A4R9BUJ3_9MICO|nr:methyltransferase domain-containing protein [Cryobacterium serini]TFD90057.1 methyltransferase domain-containing protein [Cryobacterium serini]
MPDAAATSSRRNPATRRRFAPAFVRGSSSASLRCCPGQIDTAALDLTRATANERGVTNIDFFSPADIHALEFDDATFDVAHAHQVLQHVADPVQALREMARVTKPGGIVAVRDSDYAGFCWWPQIPALDRWLELYRAAARANGGEPDAGRRLLSWARAAGLEEVTATSSTWCYSTPAERAWWGGMWADRILNSAIAGQLIESKLATSEDLQEISDAWKEWAASKDGWISILHGELIYRVIPT